MGSTTPQYADHGKKSDTTIMTTDITTEQVLLPRIPLQKKPKHRKNRSYLVSRKLEPARVLSEAPEDQILMVREEIENFKQSNFSTLLGPTPNVYRSINDRSQLLPESKVNSSVESFHASTLDEISRIVL